MSKKPKITQQPHRQFWFPHLIKALSSFLDNSAEVKDVKQRALSFFDVDSAVLNEIGVNSRVLILHNMSWARYYLFYAGYIDNSKRGVWTLTDKAKEEIPSIISIIEQDISDEMGGFPVSTDRDLKVTPFIREVFSMARAQINNQSQDGQQSVDETLEFTNQQATDDLINDEQPEDEQPEKERQSQEELAIIRNMTPTQFEHLCGLLFEKIGYDGVEVTKRSRDGGLDGFGYLVFGFVRFKVAFEAKKYAQGTNVSGPIISNLVGVMGGAIRAEKGVVITTSDFTQDAIDRANEQGSMITLINGKKLIELLWEHKIGQKTVIDREFFENIKKS